uniref:Phytanoyl-CoA dioxygenase n=1 Tax=Chromera velia CCMP2878 TaxID=1169474 RepID=A0A0G4ICX3_9ALVE|eukprot:Cvel_2274.t1-p1 / transcript=Cvel_2274.t1 / gene=Cvel_2274 / organism=Chromera_velia_CCMP2878 / gene_product=hypothetical protein / transcript_product=hypothetical protein / location=Cvel_scaffold88:43344-44691(-) / protein_length=402 / sequence_SO=supercontig / SO=protein_coding / is_pseudo=false
MAGEVTVVEDLPPPGDLPVIPSPDRPETLTPPTQENGKTDLEAVPVSSPTDAQAPATSPLDPASTSEGGDSNPVEPQIHDMLVPYISTGTEFSRNILCQIQTEGYAVIPNLLTPEECDEQLSLLWSFVETVSPGVRRDDPASWYPSPPERQEDPWPQTWRPTSGNRHPHHHRPYCVAGRRCESSLGEHFDQKHETRGLACLQSVTALTDQEEGDGCFLCWPKSHLQHQRLTRDSWRGHMDWVPLTDAEIATLREAELSPLRLPVSRGSVILWRSDLAHSGARPLKPSDGFRAVSYVSMSPACLTPVSVLPQKLEAYRRTRTGDHAAWRENWHPDEVPRTERSRKSGVPVRPPSMSPPFFANGPPAVSWRQAELYGLVKYCETETERRGEKERAEAAGVVFKE